MGNIEYAEQVAAQKSEATANAGKELKATTASEDTVSEDKPEPATYVIIDLYSNEYGVDSLEEAMERAEQAVAGRNVQNPVLVCKVLKELNATPDGIVVKDV